MIAELQLDLARMRAAPVDTGPVRMGRVIACDGGLIEVAGLPLPVGSLGVIENGADSECLAEVIGFRGGHSLMMLLGDTMLLRPRASVRALGHPGEVRVGEALLGRAVDALGAAIDGGPRLDLPHAWPLAGQREGALERASVTAPFDCGVRAINALATMGVGQRLGIMAGSGVGKSVLVDTIAGHAVADVTVVALIGERAREVFGFRQSPHGRAPARGNRGGRRAGRSCPQPAAARGAICQRDRRVFQGAGQARAADPRQPDPGGACGARVGAGAGGTGRGARLSAVRARRDHPAGGARGQFGALRRGGDGDLHRAGGR